MSFLFILFTLLVLAVSTGAVIALGLWLASRRPSSASPTPVPLPELSDADRAEVHRLLAQNQKIHAIKLVRERSNCGLREAKAYVDQLEPSGLPSGLGNPPLTAPVAPSAALAEQVRGLLAQNQKIVAIKLVRETTGWSLRESKDYVDQLERET